MYGAQLTVHSIRRHPLPLTPLQSDMTAYSVAEIQLFSVSVYLCLCVSLCVHIHV